MLEGTSQNNVIECDYGKRKRLRLSMLRGKRCTLVRNPNTHTARQARPH